MKDDDILAFKEYCRTHYYDPAVHLLPHGSYLINLGNPDEAKRKTSMTGFLDELRRCERLDIEMYNLHPGSSLGSDKQATLKRIAEGINEAHEQTEFIKVVLENMAGATNIIGSKLEDLAQIIEMVENKSRVGVCIDTCHTFAAGYDIRTKETFDAFWAEFDKVIGYKYLSGIHLNDSKAPFASNRDLHQNIGLGFIGLEAFRLIVNKPELQNMPLILETPGDDDAEVDIRGTEIKMLEWLVDKKENDPEVLAKAEELQKLGEKERNEHQKKFDKKQSSKTKVSSDRPVKRQKKLK